MQTQLFRQQHKEIVDLVKEIGAICSGPDTGVVQKAPELRSKLVSLTGKVTVHLSAEDKSLYPALFGKAGLPSAKIAEIFSQEMGTLANAYKAFVSHWPTPDAIAAQPRAFATECGEVAKALLIRIEREEKELYPLVDAQT